MNSGIVVVLCWAAGGTAATMGGRGVSAWETMEGATVGLEEGEMATCKGSMLPEEVGGVEGSSLLLLLSRDAPIKAGWILLKSWMWGLIGRSNKK
jgi:hypothetical protein